MKKKRKKVTTKYNKTIIFIGIIVSLVSIFLSVGFSVYSTRLIATDMQAKIRPDRNVRITNVIPSDTQNGGIFKATDFNMAEIQADITLPNINSSVTYQVDVKNYGNVEMGIKSINLPSNLVNILDISVSDYDLEDKIRNNGDSCESSASGCKLSVERTFFVTIKYKSGAYNNAITTFNNVLLTFDFQEVYKVTFTNFTNFHSSLKGQCAINSGTYRYDIGPYEAVFVKIGGLETSNFTIDANNVITIPNVTGEVEIIKDEIKYRFNLTTVPNDATILYQVNDGELLSATGVLSVLYPYNSVINVTVSKNGYKTFTSEYHLDDNLLILLL